MCITMEGSVVEETVTKHLHVSYSEYGKLGEKLAVIIHSDKWEFDQILCIARGGMFIGDQLSRIFKKPLAVTSACSYEGEEQGELSISTQIAMSTATFGERVLLVDDLVDSGITLAAILKSVVENNPGIQVKTAVIWKKTCSKFEPDYYVEESAGNLWIHQPFEKYDDITIEDLVE